ncbi:MAG: UvrD-helicase domain-containing protein [Clostridia bacterium]|nr:UvrD-helicase domain-containing protein [Clostridia bacterium]
MGNTTFTQSQKKALETEGNLLVSAGAGSGKTTVLTEKIVRYLVSDPQADITRLLVVTFTKKAASELKDRIAEKLKKSISVATGEKKKHLNRQLLEIGNANISTIHAFCLHLLKSQAALTGDSPDFTICDEDTADSLAYEAARECIDLEFSKNEPATDDTASMEELYLQMGSAKGETKLDDCIFPLFKAFRENGIRPSDLRKQAESRKSANSLIEPELVSLFEELSKEVVFLQKRLEQALRRFDRSLLSEKQAGPFAKAIESRASFLEKIRLALSGRDLSRARTVFELNKNLYSFKSEIINLDPDCWQQLNEDIKDFKSDLKDALSIDTASLPEEMLLLSRLESRLATLYENYLCIFKEKKKKRNLKDYTDLEQETRDLLYDGEGRKTELAHEISALFDRIYIDEYQDTNRLQDEIFRALENETTPNRFLVGDIKQSIYAFRGARPDIFNEYRNLWPEDCTDMTGSTILMNDNFRCDRPIIDVTNHIADLLFPASEMTYHSGDRLTCSKAQQDQEGRPVELSLFTKDSEIKEPDYVAEKIRDLIDREGIDPQDIAILIRSPRGSGRIENTYIQALQAKGIPTDASQSQSFFELPEIQIALCLLETINNPSSDISLAGVLLSPVFAMSLDGISNLRKEKHSSSLWDSLCDYADEHPDGELGRKCATVRDKINQYREMAKGMPSDRLILSVYADSGLPDLLSGSPETPFATHYLTELYELARQYEADGFEGLYGFLRYLSEQKELEAPDRKAKKKLVIPLSSGSSGVHILSIHLSKGLEYPFVFLVNLGKGFKMLNSETSLVHPSFLFLQSLRGQSGLSKHPSNLISLGKKHVANLNKNEEMRLLYVAMTRAKKKLFLSGTASSTKNLFDDPSQKADMLDALPDPELKREGINISVFKASSMLEWVLLDAAFPDSPLHEAFLKEKERLSAQAEAASEEPKDNTAEPSEETIVVDQPEEPAESKPHPELQNEKEEIRKNLSFQYEFSYLKNIPAKMIVSRLYPGMLDPEDEEGREGLSADAIEPEEKTDFKPFPDYSSVAAKEETKGSEYGSATHAFLEYCSFDNLGDRKTIEEEKERLVRERFLSRKTADLVRVSAIERFAQSNLFSRNGRAGRLQREYRFYASVPAEIFTEDEKRKAQLKETDTKILIQGVVDCLFEEIDGKTVIVDYKTDYLSEEEKKDRKAAEEILVRRHSNQLNYYRIACEEILGKPVDELLIYSFALGDTVRVPAVIPATID